MRVAIGADHAGYPLKEPLKDTLIRAGHAVTDLGTFSETPVDYPDIARSVAESVVLGRADRGIILCGSAQGASIAANKIAGIRAAVGHDTYSAHQSVEHDDANVLCLGARVIGPALAEEILERWLKASFNGEERHVRRVEKVRKLERIDRLHELNRAGQSAWMDNIGLDLLTSGEFRQLITEGITGVTSNPTIMEKSISASSSYDPAIRQLVREGKSPRDIAVELWADDIREAADQLRPIYDLTEGEDGYASIEVDAELAGDTEGTLAEGRRLWNLVDRPNVMIKVPATPAGLPAIQTLTTEGINVNITLLFSTAVYEQVMEAYISGLEGWYRNISATDTDVRPPSSVASFFVSRVDSKVDAAIRARVESDSSDADKDELRSLLGTAAIANAKLAYQRFLKNFSGDRWEALSDRGARVQRPLWASTSTKDPSYRDVLYVEELIGPDTVDTMPPSTIEAFKDHGYIRPSVTEHLDIAKAQLESLARHNIDLDQITEQLQHEGVEAFATSFDTLLQSIAQKRDQVVQSDTQRLSVSAASCESEVERARRAMEDGNIGRRIWERDTTVWTTDPDVAATISNRLGWLDLANTMLRQADDLERFADKARRDGLEHVVLLGMGGSSLAPEMCAQIFGTREGYLSLSVLDTTVPDIIAKVESSVNLARTLFIVASKSGSTIETLSHLAYFWEKAGFRGDQFVAITDPGTSLQELAEERGFRRCFINPPDIGGRYSVLSYFGLVPAALIGLDVKSALLAAIDRASACHTSEVEKNPGLLLGTMIAAAAQAGRDKLTIATSPELEPFGLWLEQLIAESTGKQGRGIIPVVGEPLGTADVYGDDRTFIGIVESGDTTVSEKLKALNAVGHPTAELRLSTRLDLLGECFTWEFATAVAGAVLGINPFDEPNVQEAKDATRSALDAYERDGVLPQISASQAEEVCRFIADSHDGDYVVLQAYLPYDDAITAALQRVRVAVRDTQHRATTVGFGPRFLHSTGQLHKGGPNTGVFVQFVAAFTGELEIPGSPFGFGVLNQAQAVGDFQALVNHQRRVIRFELGSNPVEALDALAKLIGASRAG